MVFIPRLVVIYSSAQLGLQVGLLGQSGTTEAIEGYNTLNQKTGIVSWVLRSSTVMNLLRINHWATVNFRNTGRLVGPVVEVVDDGGQGRVSVQLLNY